MGDSGSGSSSGSGNGSALARFLCSSELNEMSLSNLLLTEACNMPSAACVCVCVARQADERWPRQFISKEQGSARESEGETGRHLVGLEGERRQTLSNFQIQFMLSI